MTQLFYGDCLEIIKNIPDSSVDMILTDPPYKIETSGGGIYKQGRKEYIKDIGQMSNGFPEEILNQCCRVMKKINIYLFCSQKQIIPLLDFFVKKEEMQLEYYFMAQIKPGSRVWKQISDGHGIHYVFSGKRRKGIRELQNKTNMVFNTIEHKREKEVRTPDNKTR